MTKVTDQLTEANYASSIFKSNERLKDFFSLIPSHRRDEDAIICRSFFSTEFILRLSNATGLAYSQIQNIHKLLLLDDNGVYLWVKVENLLTFEERTIKEKAEKEKENKDKPEKDKKPEEKAEKENKTEEKAEKEKNEDVVIPFDDKVYLMNLKSFKDFSESDYSPEEAN